MNPTPQQESTEGLAFGQNVGPRARKEERFPCPVVTVVYVRDGQPTPERDLVWLINLSQQGLAFLSDKAFAAGELLRARVQVPGLNDLEMEARVAHCTLGPSWGHVVGCSLTEPLSADKVSLVVTIEPADELDPSRNR